MATTKADVASGMKPAEPPAPEKETLDPQVKALMDSVKSISVRLDALLKGRSDASRGVEDDDDDKRDDAVSADASRADEDDDDDDKDRDRKDGARADEDDDRSDRKDGAKADKADSKAD